MKFWGPILLLPLMLWGQAEFFGYMESEVDIMELDSQRYSFGYNKFRLDMEARPNDNVLIGANVNIQKYWGQTTWNIYDFLPGFSGLGITQNIELQDTILVDNIYMRLSFVWADLTLGRQQISPGVGYAWNPTDIFNTKSLLDPSYEQTGVSSIRLDISLGNRSTLNAVLQPGGAFNKSTKQLWLKTGLGRFDVDVTLAELQQATPASMLFGDAFDAKRTMVGGSLVGEILEYGIWIEFAHNMLDSVHDPSSGTMQPRELQYDEYVLGVDHTFDNSIYIVGEYLHNGFGTKDKSLLGLQDYLYSLSGEGRSLMQDYGFVYIMHPTFDFVSLSTLAIANFNDKSGTLAPQLDWNAFEDTNISLQGSLFWGDDDTEFGLQDWGLRLRVRSDF